MLGCVTAEWNVGVFGSWKGDCRSGGNWEFWKEEEGLWLSLALSIARFERWKRRRRRLWFFLEVGTQVVDSNHEHREEVL